MAPGKRSPNVPSVKITVDMSEATQCPKLALKFRVSEVDWGISVT